MQISISNLKYQIDQDLSLKIEEWQLPEGRSSLVCGGNGSGKSILAQLLAGRLKSEAGQITVSCPDRIASVSFDIEEEILEEDRYNDDSEFMEGGLDQGRTVCEITGDSDNLIQITEKLGIADLLDHPFMTLSTGETRKTLIARALMKCPQLLILDEPYSGLDLNSRSELHQVINHLVEDGIQVLLFDFYHEDLPVSLDHVLYLENGQIAIEGERAEVIESAEWKAKTEYQVNLPHHLPDCICYDHLDERKPFVEIYDVEVAYNGKTVFSGLNWTFKRGEHWRIAGPNGSGKSTLLGMISGDNPKAYGKDITLFGRKRGTGESIWDIKKHYGIVGSALHRDYRVSVSLLGAVVSGFYDTIGLYTKPTHTQIELGKEWLRLLGMAGRDNTPFNKLSYGEQRRVLIARAMVKLPLILILDEPCLGLDNKNRKLVLALIDYIAFHSQTHILFVSHDPRDQLTCLNHKLEFIPDGDIYRAEVL